MSRLKDLYNEQIVDAMTKKFGYKNVMEVPKLSKIVINMGVGEAKENAKLLDAAISDMEAITGQKAVTTKAKNSVANFKIREGMPIGCKVTLRGEKMYEFADRLINLALPRVRDFRGVNPNAFDGRGNYALGIKEQLIFPEVEYDKVDKTISELIHLLASQSNFTSDRHTLSDFEVSDRFFSFCSDCFLSCNKFHICDCSVKKFSVLFCLANTHVNNDFLEFWHFHYVFVSEFLGHGIHDLVLVKIF